MAAKLLSMMNLSLSLGQVLAGTIFTVSTLVSVMLWVDNTFERKQDALNTKVELSVQIEKMGSKIEETRSKTDQIAIDVSYIRGRLEHK